MTYEEHLIGSKDKFVIQPVIYGVAYVNNKKCILLLSPMSVLSFDHRPYPCLINKFSYILFATIVFTTAYHHFGLYQVQTVV